MNRIVVVGAGIGGLTAAALLAKGGDDVTVLEAHIYPGGCAGTFYHQGYRFDAGATLAAGFDTGGIMTGLGERLDIKWSVEPLREAMVVHLPDGAAVTRWTDPGRWQDERRGAFDVEGERFWRWQESAADRMWGVAQASLPWPPQSFGELPALVRAGARLAAQAPLGLPGLLADSVRPVAAHLPASNPRLRTFVDGQLLISAQVTADHANALYGAAALDLSRRGAVNLPGGMGTIALRLADAVRAQGGKVLYRQRVTRVVARGGQSFELETNKQANFPADTVMFNLPPWDAAALLGAGAPPKLARQQLPADGWGVFVVYVGFDASGLAADYPLHHQVISGLPLGEGNSVFMSLSEAVDKRRAPEGCRALTLSTHTALAPWWELFERDRPAYEACKDEYTRRLLAVAERVLPGISSAHLVLPGTPVSFQRFTHRSRGWVGGFPQTSLFRAHGPRLGQNLWMVGDSIFPGQSAPAVALGGMRVAAAIMKRGAAS